ncbi:APC family permease [Azotosporobacter soli]|uniref:APC family permease n=1 Tax=Azotosporobacter soli TaxID=3055040 RepID=UPI0031FEDCFC
MELKLKRSITWRQGVAMTVGAVLGSGILVLPVLAAELAGPASLVSWFLMGVLTVPMVVALAKLAARWPEAGGIAAYARQAFGARCGAATGWLFLGTVPFGAPIVSLIGAHYLGSYLGLGSSGVTWLALAMLALAVGFNYRGIQISGAVQMAVVGAIALVLLAAVLTAMPNVRAEAFQPMAPHGWQPVGVAMTLLFWAYVGWEMIGHLAEEFRDPARDIRLSLGWSLLIVNGLYLLLALVTVGTGVYLGPDKMTALASMVEGGWGRGAGLLVALLGAASCYATIHTYVAGFSRLVFAQAREGAFLPWFAELHPKYQTPHRVLLLLFPVSASLLLAGEFFQWDIKELIQFPSAIFIALYIIAMAAAVKLLPKGFGQSCAALSLAVCVAVYLFTGWVMLYPAVLGAIGWWASGQQEAQAEKGRLQQF